MLFIKTEVLYSKGNCLNMSCFIDYHGSRSVKYFKCSQVKF